jgi:predicted amidohydrolase YtcJ
MLPGVETADLLLTGASVRIDHRTPDRCTDAVAVRDGRVVAHGERARALRAAEVLDLGGAVLLPAFGDGHAHPLQGGRELAQAPIRDCTSVAEVVAAVRRHAAAHPDEPWVRGGSYDPALAPGGLFDARWLDEAVADRPVCLIASDHHCAWVNTAALRLAGIDERTPDPPAGAIARRADGSALGTLVEWTAMELVTRLLPEPSVDEDVTALEGASRAFAAAGVTWVQEAAAAPDDVEVWLGAAEQGRLHVGANLALRAEPGEWPAQVEAFREVRAALDGHPLLSAVTVKMFADGVIEAGTAALLEPYDDAPHTCGLPVWEPAELAEAAVAFDAAGFQLHIHAIGDAATRSALDAIERATRANGPRDRRPVVTHVQLITPEDVPRFGALGVVANAQTLWAKLDRCQDELTIPRIGDDRARLQYPYASLVGGGAVLSTASDWPVTSLRPLECLAVGVTRRNERGEPPGGWLPEQRLTTVQVLAGATTGIAWQAFAEECRGTLAVGMQADLVAVSEDPHAVPAERWADLDVLGTWRAGTRTYDGEA